ncbi:DUF6626 family protein [Shinella sedimenti]|uniref:Transcriptional regulator n=1 Tax=Shinella sedimenti TaxID=2919913 RepID=A0ABT0CSE7_9HYPH|nr:DUF6626 family protein [Shinella sedimenti]MCJ8151528.1 hypothetical protein [Shinella sedimenti]
MTVKEIYEVMAAAGLANSQMEFSQIWLGRSPRYYSHLIATQREPGLATLCGVAWRLDRMPLSGKPVLLELKQQLVDEINRRAITDIRRHRS